MATLSVKHVPRLGKVLTNKGIKFSTSNYFMIRWRLEQDIEPNPNRYGPLTNLPDYSFVDGRTTPISKSAYTKIKYQEKLCKKIVELSGEIDFAVERHKKIQTEAVERRKLLIESKLKPKGVELLKKKSAKS